MKSWIVGALVGACVGVVLYLLFSQKSVPSQESRHKPPSPPPAAPAAPPVVLADVVEVTEIDHLLDPPAKPVSSGEPFDGTTPVLPSIPAGPERIPPAVDGPVLAPMPRSLPRDIELSFDF